MIVYDDYFRFLVLTFAVMLAVPQELASQVSSIRGEQDVAVRLLSSSDIAERDLGLQVAVTRLDTGQQLSPALRSALIEVAWEEVRGGTDPAGTALESDFERMMEYYSAVARLRDPAAIPVLVQRMSGGIAYNALAGFGEEAFSAVLEKVERMQDQSASTAVNDVSGGLIVLRFMVEEDSLGPESMDGARAIVKKLLSKPRHWRVLGRVMQLAYMLGDPEFVDTLAGFASSPSLISPYVKDGLQIERLQRQAVDLLAGRPPLPQRRRLQG